ncbi:hypothetical protein SMD10_21200 [Consotaella sp. CSK11QG-6]
MPGLLDGAVPMLHLPRSPAANAEEDGLKLERDALTYGRAAA